MNILAPKPYLWTHSINNTIKFVSICINLIAKRRIKEKHRKCDGFRTMGVGGKGGGVGGEEDRVGPLTPLGEFFMGPLN